MENLRTCPLCGDNQDGETVCSRRREGTAGEFWTIVRCGNCGMVYLRQKIDYTAQEQDFDWADTFPAERSRRRGTEANAGDGGSTRTKLSLAQGFRRLRKSLRGDRSLKTLAIVYRYKQGGRLCDFGCGTGKLLIHAVRRFEVWGMDISRRQADAARQRVPEARIAVCPAADVDFPRASFDAVTMQSYIEHDWEPLAALRTAWKLLKPGGVVVLKTPNYDCWNRRLLGARWCGYRFPDHCNYFTAKTLSAALVASGFELLAGMPRDRLAFSDNMYLAGEKPAVETSNSAEQAGKRNRCLAELSG